MPELPEVELTARNLRTWARGATISDARIAKTRITRGGSIDARALIGRRIASVDRRGKWLRLTLDDDRRLFSHLGMTGRWVRRTIDAPEERSERLRFDVTRRDRETSLRYLDQRMFGRLLVADEDIEEWTSLGPDPLIDGVDGRLLARAIGNRKRTIKEVLMDQAVLAGIGNIQATEALWRARIDPRTKASELSSRRLGALARAIGWTLDRTLGLEEGPEIQYVEDPGAPNPFVVYGRDGEPCPRCRTTLVRIVLGGRATVLCPTCQLNQDVE